MPPFRGLREAVGVVSNLILYRWSPCHCEERSDVAIFPVEIATSLALLAMTLVNIAPRFFFAFFGKRAIIAPEKR